MTYAYDNYVQLPVVDLYDSSIMQMAINAAKDQYDRGQKQIEDFYTKYGDFMSPFAKDMERYGQMMGGINNILNDAYSKGIDLTKSPEGRALINRLVYSVNPQEYNMMRSNAKTGYAYLDAIQKLRSQGKYSEAQELFDIMQSGGTKFSDFGTRDPETGALNTWDRTSPIEATSLLDLTYDSYKGRTPHDLTADQLREAGIPFDPRYQYTGYLDVDLMKTAPGAAMAIAADPRAAFFRNEAEKKVAARGGSYTQADVDAQFYRDIADANKWALVDPTKKADEFALEDYRTANDNWLDAQKQSREFKYAKALKEYEYSNNPKNNPNNPQETGHSLLGDFYSTTLAQAAGIEYFPQGGATPETLEQWLEDAKKIQKNKIKGTGHVLDATGMFMSPEKIRGIIPSNGKNGNGEFLDRNYFDSLHTEDDIRSSYDGWRMKGKTEHESREWREKYQEESKQIIDAVSGWNKNNGYDYKLKVVPEKDKNGHNTYGIVGSDGRWHTYARVRVYMSDGKKSTLPVADRSDSSKKLIPQEGKVMLLEVGLKSNKNAASPDLSISARENVGPYAFNTLKKWTGLTGNRDFPWGANGFSYTSQSK